MTMFSITRYRSTSYRECPTDSTPHRGAIESQRIYNYNRATDTAEHYCWFPSALCTTDSKDCPYDRDTGRDRRCGTVTCSNPRPPCSQNKHQKPKWGSPISTIVMYCTTWIIGGIHSDCCPAAMIYGAERSPATRVVPSIVYKLYAKEEAV